MSKPPANTEAPSESGSAVSGRLLVLAAAVLWSSSGWFARNPTFADWPPEARGLVLAFWRALFAGVLILPMVRRPRLQLRQAPLALCFVLMNVTFLSAMTLTTPANAIWLQSTAPMWVFLAGVLFLRERSTANDAIMLTFGMLGVGTILLYEFRGDQQLGTSLGLASGICYAGVVVFMRQLRREDAAWITALNLLVTAAVLAPYVAYRGLWPSASQLLILAAFGLCQMGLPYVFFGRGLRTISGQEASGIVLLEPILVPVWVYLAWGDRANWWTIAGGTLIFTGLALRYLRATLKS